jgi:TolB protein
MNIRKMVMLGVASFALAALSVTAPRAGGTPKNGLIVVEALVGGGSNFQLVSVDPNDPAKPPVQITHLQPSAPNVNGMSPAFSPDGKRLAFVYQGPNDRGPNAFVINVDGTNLKPLTSDFGAVAVSWSRDGSRILLTDVNTKTGLAAMSTVRADNGSAQTFLTDDLFSNAGDTYTPDGKQILFGSSAGGISSAVWRMNADGSGKERLTDVARVFCPAGMSPDGEKVLLIPFCANADFKPQNIFVMNADGTGVRQLTNPGRGIVDLAGVYSPDGTKIAFSSNRANPNGLFGVWTMNADGSNPKLLLSNAAFPTWGPAQ